MRKTRNEEKRREGETIPHILRYILTLLTYSDILSGMYSDILSSILSGIVFGPGGALRAGEHIMLGSTRVGSQVSC